MVEEIWGISRTDLAETHCELLAWKRPNGRLEGVNVVNSSKICTP